MNYILGDDLVNVVFCKQSSPHLVIEQYSEVKVPNTAPRNFTIKVERGFDLLA